VPGPENLGEALFQTLHEAYYQELLSEELIVRWKRLHVVAGWLSGLTASGSVFAGLSLWEDPNGKVVWLYIASTAAAISVLHSVANVPERTKEEEQTRRRYSSLRTEVESVIMRVRAGYGGAHVTADYETLRARIVSLNAETNPSMWPSYGLRRAVQTRLNDILSQKGYTP
jgi:hypothetical protein